MNSKKHTANEASKIGILIHIISETCLHNISTSHLIPMIVYNTYMRYSSFPVYILRSPEIIMTIIYPAIVKNKTNGSHPNFFSRINFTVFIMQIMTPITINGIIIIYTGLKCGVTLNENCSPLNNIIHNLSIFLGIEAIDISAPLKNPNFGKSKIQNLNGSIFPILISCIIKSGNAITPNGTAITTYLSIPNFLKSSLLIRIT